jgi:hypothetical protein
MLLDRYSSACVPVRTFALRYEENPRIRPYEPECRGRGLLAPRCQSVGIGAESPKDVEKIAGKLSQEGEGQSVVNCEPELMTIWSP